MTTQHLLLALALLLAAFDGANGLYMVANPQGWYDAVPGVAATGPANSHFIIDVGFAYLTSMALLILAVLRPRQRGAFALAAAVWPMLHAGFHVVGDIGAGTTSTGDVLGIYVPAFTQLALAGYWLAKD